MPLLGSACGWSELGNRKACGLYWNHPPPEIFRIKTEVSCKRSVNPDRPFYKSPRKVLVLLEVTYTQKMKPVMALKR